MAKKQKPPTIVMTEGKRETVSEILCKFNQKVRQHAKLKITYTKKFTLPRLSLSSLSDNARNGYKSKRVNSSYGNFSMEVPQIAIRHSLRRLYRNVKRIFPRLTKKLSQCTHVD